VIEELERNVNAEIEMLREISSYMGKLEYAAEQDKKLLEGAITALKASMRVINESIPSMLRDISMAEKLPSWRKKKGAGLENIKFKRIEGEVEVVLNKKDKEKFLKELSISESFVRKLKKEATNKEDFYEFKASRGYLKLANKYFMDRADKWIKKGYFESLSLGLRKANVDVLFKSYVAMIFLTVILSTFFGVILTIFLLFIDVSFIWPFFSVYDGGYLARIGKIFWIPLIVPILTFVVLYYYPSTEKKSLGKKINQELPFAVIHMSAISGSGIEPSEIFKIIGLNKEYPYLRKEIRKVLNQINLYGYDLVTALNNASKVSPSDNLAELFSGLSTTITSGSNLKDFFEKRSGSLLLNYRLEREKYTKLVETFLDIYISLVVAAPMIFLLLMILMTVSGIGVGFTPVQLSIISVFGIALLNVAFLVFLQIKQPSY
jgi:archaeal flagellar protein FlaJ